MTLHASFVWKNPDATRDLNNRLRKIVRRGIVDGGDVNPVGGLNISISPSVAVSFDGMTVLEDETTSLEVTQGVKQYICLWAKYNEGGSPATPTLKYVLLTQLAYDSHPEKDYMIVYATVNTPISTVLDEHLSYVERDEVDPLGRDWFRGRVPTASPYPGDLPVGDPEANRLGDFYFVDDERTFYFWDSSNWEALNTGAYNSEVSLMNDTLASGQRDRIANGTGVIGSRRPSLQEGTRASELNIVLDDTFTKSIANSIDFFGFNALVNGHYVEVHSTRLALDPKPNLGAGDRFDLVYIEVWRDTVSAPQTDVVYERNPDGVPASYNLEQASEKVETMEWDPNVQSGVGDNFNVHKIDSYNHEWRAVRWEIKTRLGITDTALYNPSSTAVAASILNRDGVAFESQPAPAGSAGIDPRAWIATSPSSADGYSWAMPLFVIRRRENEDHTTNDAVRVFRNGVRQAFPVYPVCDVENAARALVNAKSDLDRFDYLSPKPSGFKSLAPLEPGVDPNTLKFFGNGPARFRIRGYDDVYNHVGAVDGIDLGAPPSLLGSWKRVIVYLKLSLTLYADEFGVKNNYVISNKKAYFGRNGLVKGMGFKEGVVQYEVVAQDLGQVDVRDSDDAMTAAGWDKGDPVQLGDQYRDGGIWSKNVGITGDWRVHPYGYEWAIPIALVHRRNTNIWTADGNPNGSTGRPDGRTNPNMVYPDDIVDLRHTIGMPAQASKAVIEDSINKLLKGKLRTRLANKYLGSGSGGVVAGSRILQTDSLGAVTGAYQLTTPNGLRRIWSDAKEFHIVSASFSLTADSSVPNLYEYDATTTPLVGALTIKAPPGAHLVRHIPGVVYADAVYTGADYLDFLGPPCWTTKLETDPEGPPSPACAKYIDITKEEKIIPFWEPGAPGVTAVPPGAQPFNVESATLDDSGRATEMTGYVNISPAALPTGGTATLSWWVHYDRTFVGDYAINYGLSEIPDEVHRVTLNPETTPEDVGIGAPYIALQKTSATPSVDFTVTDIVGKITPVGVISLVGIDQSTIITDGFTANVTSITMNQSQSTITVTFDASIGGGTVEAVIFYKDDGRDKWVEIGRGGKSVQAIFSWGETPTSPATDLGAILPENYAFDLGSAIWSYPQVGERVFDRVPFIWTRVDPLTGDWTLVEQGAKHSANVYSNILTLDTNHGDLSDLQRYVYVVYPSHSALGSSDRLQIDYTYTPYQGLSSTGGAAIPTPLDPTVDRMKAMLHGRIEENSEFYATQSGPTSYFSGVDAWSGTPANNTSHLRECDHNYGQDRFSSYNRTESVKRNPFHGSVDLTHSRADNDTLNAAAILRLPFPTNPAMVDTLVDYHNGVMEFDLDPARAGAGSGYKLYAPIYGQYRTYASHQYVNGLAPLLPPGQNRSRSMSQSMTADSYRLEGDFIFTAVSDSEPNAIYCELTDSTDSGRAFLPLHTHDDELIKRTRTFVITDVGLARSAPALIMSGVRAYNYQTQLFYDVNDAPNYHFVTANTLTYRKEWTALQPFVTNSPQPVYFCTFPGPLLSYYRWKAQPNLSSSVPTSFFFNMAPADAVPSFLQSTDALIDTSPLQYRQSSVNRAVTKFTDLVTVPFSGGQLTYPCPIRDAGSIRQPYKSTQAGSSGAVSLRGVEIGYPPSWDPTGADATLEDNLLQRSLDFRGAGRGMYCGTTTERYNMPVFVPGSGTDLRTLLVREGISLGDGVEAPLPIPYIPETPLFAQTNQVYVERDIGGPIAYVFYGALVRPRQDQFRNRAILQISGGPTGGIDAGTRWEDGDGQYAPDDLHGTAVDAFWPIGRPLFDPVE